MTYNIALNKESIQNSHMDPIIFTFSADFEVF